VSSLVLLLLDLEEEYVAAFRSWAEGERRRLVVASLSAALQAESRSVGLCVVRCPVEAEDLPERLRALRKQLRGCPMVVLAGDLTVDGVVRLLRSGISDVIGLPAPPHEVVARVALLGSRGSESGVAGELVGQSAAMQELRRQLERAAPTHSTVLVTGETGVGKGVVARCLHALSLRSSGPFVHVDCSAFAPTVVESELFGHERGAFTGAVGQRVGRFEQAAGGTLFLDEIGDLDALLQRKLLRALQDRQFERVGGQRTLPMTARVIAATHRDLHAAVSRGEFRADLLFRLNVIHLEVPPLRSRPEDIPLLARAGIEILSARLEIHPPDVEDSFFVRLSDYWWPGNVRELMNVLERVLVRDRAGVLDAASVGSVLDTAARHAEIMAGGPPPTAMPPPGPRRTEKPVKLDSGEIEEIHRVLVETGGNLARASRRLGLARSTLRYRVMLLGLEHLIPKD
jgi:DNA-binding NtrC family response regulator